MSFEFRPKTRLVAALLVAAALTGCAHGPKAPPPGAVDADKYLFDRGTELLKKKNWITAREYFRRIVDSYPQSVYRADAKLGVADSYLGENRIDSLILSVNEFREFLQFFPLNEKADYAQFHLALAQSKQMLKAERDQTATIEALAEVKRFRTNYPNSSYKPDMDKLYREVRDRLSESEFKVGMTYYRGKGMVAALSRFTTLLAEDPEYTRRDDVYYYTGMAFMRVKAYPQAIVYFDKYVKEFPRGKRMKESQKQFDLATKLAAAEKK